MDSALLVDKSWRLLDALTLIRALQPTVKPFGYHVTLGGGVLNAGFSKKDLDLFFLPLAAADKSSPEKLLAELTSLWGPGKAMGVARKQQMVRDLEGRYHLVSSGPEYPPDQSCYSHKLKFAYSGLRIDVFVIGESKPASDADKLAEEVVDAQPTFGERLRAVNEAVNRLATPGEAVSPDPSPLGLGATFRVTAGDIRAAQTFTNAATTGTLDQRLRDAGFSQDRIAEWQRMLDEQTRNLREMGLAIPIERGR